MPEPPQPQLDPLASFLLSKQAEFIGACQNLHAQYLVFTSQNNRFDPQVAKIMSFHLEGILTIIKTSVREAAPKPTEGTQPS